LSVIIADLKVILIKISTMQVIYLKLTD